MFEFFSNVMRSLENMYTVGAENGTIGVDYFRVFGVTLILGLVGFGIMKLLENLGIGLNNIMTAMANGIQFVFKGFGDMFTSTGKAIELVGTGLGNLFSFPHTVAVKAAEVRIAWINATKRLIKVIMVDGQRSLTVDISGDVENPEQIITASAEAGDRVYTRPMERMLTQKPRVIEGEVVK